MLVIRTIIVDDEILARKYLIEMLKEHSDIQVVQECSNGFEAVKAISKHKPDLLLLDIQMPKLDGFEVLELVETNFALVLVIAYDQYALKAFNSHAVDYLLKPFSKERLCEALTKVRKNIGKPLPSIEELKHTSSNKQEFQKRIVVKEGNKIVIIKEENIDYIQAEDDYISIFSNGKSHLKHQTISSLEKCMDPSRFVRIHRSIIVNIEKISSIELMAKDKYAAILKNHTQLSISRSRHKKLKEILG